MSKPSSKEEKTASQKTISVGNENYPQKPKGKDSKIGDEYEFRIIANAGDPGLTEDSHYDFLSRFVICMADPPERCPYEGKKRNLFYLVKRPTHLWIGHEGTANLAPDKDNQDDFGKHRRRDALGNINVGKAREYVINSIPEMNKPYRLGDRITAKITQYEESGKSSFFSSAWDSDIFRILYGPDLSDQSGFDINHGVMDFNCFYTNHYWHDHGAPGPTAGATDAARGSAVRQLKAIINNDSGVYTGPIEKGSGLTRQGPSPSTNSLSAVLHIYMIDHALGVMNPAHAATLKELQQNRQEFSHLINADASKGGYVKNGMRFNRVHFEDVNQENRQRVNTDECMPLVIASPSNFPTPSHRNVSGIQYMPAYAQVVAAQGAGGETIATGGIKTIPMVGHVIDNGDSGPTGTAGITSAVIQANIDKLNELFAANTPALDVRFAWDGQERRVSVPQGTTYQQSDDTCKSLSPAVVPNSNFNFWIIPCGAAGDSCGSWSTFPGSHGSSLDGIVMSVSNLVGGWSTSFGLGNIWAHEAGHYLGLRHIWGDGDCNQDDGVTDTPNQDGPTSGCPNPKPKACDGATDVMTENFMNYTTDACTSNFTQGQVDRINATLEGPRLTLII